MNNRKKFYSRKVGFPPESLIYTGDASAASPGITLIKYNEYSCKIVNNLPIQDLNTEIEPDKVNWVHFNGLNHVDSVEKIGEWFGIHPLLLEDVLNIGQIPKYEESDDFLFVVLKHVMFNSENNTLDISHLGLILGDNYVLSFSEDTHGIFQNIIDSIDSAKGKIRKRKADYLFYVLLDAIVDNYYIVFENLQDKIEALEDQLIENPKSNFITVIHQLKKQLTLVRKSVFPLSEALNRLLIDDNKYINRNNQMYFKDVFEHTLQITEIYETCRELLSNLMELNITNMNHNMNSVMKTLTIVSTIFIPLTFLAGVYGMNFKHMPELDKTWTYPALWAFMIAAALLMLFYMKRKKWF